MSTPGQLVEAMKRRMPLEVSAAFGRLVQTKHLYQSETVDMTFIESELSNVDRETAAAVRAPICPLRDGRWIPSQSASPNAPFVGHIDKLTQHLRFDTATAKLFCETCDRVEPFNPVLIDDLTERSGYLGQSPKTIQVFAFTFLCQSCKEVPEVFWSDV